jgi:hypothetical protein
MPAENPPVLLSVPSMVNSAIDCWDDCKVWGNNKNKYKSPHSAFNSRSITTHDPSVEEICLRVSCPCCKSSAKGFSMATVEVLPSRCRCFQCPYIPLNNHNTSTRVALPRGHLQCGRIIAHELGDPFPRSPNSPIRPVSVEETMKARTTSVRAVKCATLA